MGVRRWLLAAGTVGILALGLSGCSEMNANALTLTDGQPAVRNCGAWIHDVEVRDADTGRTVWSVQLDDWSVPSSSTPAGAPTSQQRARRTSVVVLGTLPSTDWSERTPLRLEPTPERWEFIINERDHLVADDSRLQQDRYFADGKNMSFDDFRNDVCNDDAGGLVTLVRLAAVSVAIVVGLIVIVATVVSVRRSGRRRPRTVHQATPPPPRSPLDGPPWN